MHCVQSVCCAVLRAHVDATTVPRAWLALGLFLLLLALRGVTVLITRVRLLHFDKDYNYTASGYFIGSCCQRPQSLGMEHHPNQVLGFELFYHCMVGWKR